MTSTDSTPSAEVGVDLRLLRELGSSYTAYRQSLAGPFDPVRTLGLTGDILTSVRRILATTGQAVNHSDGRKAGQ